MNGSLNPTPLDIPSLMPTKSRHSGGFATIPKDRVLRLARTMPDCQSAILVLLTWHATLNEKMTKGRCAGQTLASLSGKQLAEMTRRPLRTIRHSLRQLVSSHRIAKEPVAAGHKNMYGLPFLTSETA